MIGFALSQATGLNTPSLLNPATDAQDTAPSRIVDLIAMLVALALGAHRVVLAGALESFRIVPPGADMNLAAGAHTIISVATNSIGVGLRLSMPLVAVALITHVGLAMVARAAPSLQIFNAGLTVLVAVGLVAFISDEANLVRGLGVHFSSAGPQNERVLRAVKSSLATLKTRTRHSKPRQNGARNTESRENSRDRATRARWRRQARCSALSSRCAK